MTTRTGPRGDADLARDSERLGPRSSVGDHERGEDGDHRRRHREVHAARREVGRDGGEDDALLHAVQRGVEEGAEGRPLARRARVATVERVHDRADDERDPGEEEQALGDQHGGDHVQREAA